MDRDEILRRSKQENAGKYDERELAAFGKASRVGMLVGGVLCVILILVSDMVFNNPLLALAGWMVYFAMQGSSQIVLFVNMKKKSYLVIGIVEIICAVAFAVAVAIKAMV